MDTRACTVQFHFHKALEQAKLISGDRNQNLGCLWGSGGASASLSWLISAFRYHPFQLHGSWKLVLVGIYTPPKMTKPIVKHLPADYCCSGQGRLTEQDTEKTFWTNGNVLLLVSGNGFTGIYNCKSLRN